VEETGGRGSNAHASVIARPPGEIVARAITAYRFAFVLKLANYFTPSLVVDQMRFPAL
jgi:hypothetical protein